MKKLALSIFLSCIVIQLAFAQTVWVETENFAHKGGWSVDGLFIDQMGSSYLLAHGVGIPVDNASTKVAVPKKGIYQVWVRTFNWNAPWDASGVDGFQTTIILTKKAKEKQKCPDKNNG